MAAWSGSNLLVITQARRNGMGRRPGGFPTGQTSDRRSDLLSTTHYGRKVAEAR